jgi:carbonic anhydrase
MYSPFTRRRFLRETTSLGLSLLCWGALAGCTQTNSSQTPRDNQKLNADQALQELTQGNKRYVAGQTTTLHESTAHRAEVAKGQHPFAVIVGCSDSRVPPELVFDQGLGDLFVIRVAGNLVDDEALGSIEFAAEEFKLPLVVVLGHERCGAVKATIETLEKGSEAPGHIASLVKAIKPAIEKARAQAGDLLDNAVRANVERVVEQLKTSGPILSELVSSGKLRIVGARYDLDEGAVEFL